MTSLRWRRHLGRSVDAVCARLGRRQVVRASRFVLHRARLDMPNDPAVNGEYALQRWMLDALPRTSAVTVLDAGANIGAWSLALLSEAAREGRIDALRLHAFEPVRETYQTLETRLTDAARVNHLALSDRAGEVTMNVVAGEAGTNSVYRSQAGGTLLTEVTRATTIDDYRRDYGLGHIDMLKVDTEGHDLAVLNGARIALAEQAISLVQFEYNHRWVHARHFLKDAFDLLQPLGYRVGKLTPRGMETYPAWDPELENFVEGNFLACTEEFAVHLPQVPWWKDDKHGGTHAH
jgi:FkbM family methyltransferase